MSLVKVWIHYVWATKLRTPLLTEDIRYDVFSHIKENSSIKNIEILSVNGYIDHIHCLVKLKSNQSVSEVARLIKGESSFWITKNDLIGGKFEWQKAYYAESVSRFGLNKIQRYIDNQKEHHERQELVERWETIVND